LTIQLAGDSRMNHLEERGNDTIQARSNSDFDVKYATIQFYGNNHNSIRLLDRPEILHGVSWHVFLPWVKISGPSEFRKASQYRSTEVVRILLFTSFWLVDFLFGKDAFPIRTWQLVLGIFNGLQNSFQVWQGFINVSKSFSYKDSLVILATTREEDFRINSTFRSDFLVYLGLLNGDKSDSSIFRMVIFGFLLFSS